MRKSFVMGLAATGAIIVAVAAYTLSSGFMQGPRSAAEWEAQGLKQYSANDLDAAAVSFTRAINLSPQNQLNYIRRALVLRDQHRYGEAAADYARAIERNDLGPQFQSRTHALRGYSLGRTGRTEEAFQDFEKSIALDPNSADGYRERGLLKIYIGDFVGARSDLQSALKISAETLTQLNLGITYYWERDWPKAWAHFRAAREKDPKIANIAMWDILGRLRTKETVNAADYQDIDQNRWPGQVVAHLLERMEPLDKLIEDAGNKNDPRVVEYICTGTFAAFSRLQIQDKIDKTAADYAKIDPNDPYLDSVYRTFERCGDDNPVVRLIGQNEVKYLKAQRQ